jgi:hypothetical protein
MCVSFATVRVMLMTSCRDSLEGCTKYEDWQRFKPVYHGPTCRCGTSDAGTSASIKFAKRNQTYNHAKVI